MILSQQTSGTIGATKASTLTKYGIRVLRQPIRGGAKSRSTINGRGGK